MRKSKEKMMKIADKFTAADDPTQKEWEAGDYGRNQKYAQAGSMAEASGTFQTTIRLDRELVAGLRELAKKKGIPYQTYIKILLTEHVGEKLKEA